MVASVQPHRTTSAGPAPLLAAQRRELELQRKLGRKDDARNPAVVQTAAAQMTAELFFAPLLAEMRKFPFGKSIGHGGRTEEVFGEQFDVRIADRIAATDSGGLVAQLAARLTRRDDATPNSAGSIISSPVRKRDARALHAAVDAHRYQDLLA